MPIAWEYLPDQKLILSFWDGKVGLWEWNTYTTDINVPEHQDVIGGLAHLATASLEFTPNDVTQILAHYKANPSHRKIKMALVAGENMSFAEEFVARAINYSSVNMRVFRSILPACAWLGVDGGLAVKGLRRLRDSLM